MEGRRERERVSERKGRYVRIAGGGGGEEDEEEKDGGR